MASTLRTVAQIPARIKYLVAVSNPASSDVTGTLLDANCYAFTCTEGSFAGKSHLSSAEAATIFNATATAKGVVDFAVGDLFKDLGRQIVIYDPTSYLHLAIFREVQRVNGSGSSGVPVNYDVPIFVRVWSAAGHPAYLARVGPGA